MTHDVEAAGHEGILREFDEYGYCVVPDVLDVAGRASRYGPNHSNQRVWALLNRGEEFVRLATHPLALEVVRARLGAAILLSNLTANITAPGGDREIGRLHTDQDFLPEPWPYLLAVNVAWFLDEFTTQNGATLVVPKSHRLGTYPSSELAPAAPAQVTGPPGAMAVLDGRLHHATGLNRTNDRKRRGVFATYVGVNGPDTSGLNF